MGLLGRLRRNRGKRQCAARMDGTPHGCFCADGAGPCSTSTGWCWATAELGVRDAPAHAAFTCILRGLTTLQTKSPGQARGACFVTAGPSTLKPYTLYDTVAPSVWDMGRRGRQAVLTVPVTTSAPGEWAAGGRLLAPSLNERATSPPASCPSWSGWDTGWTAIPRSLRRPYRALADMEDALDKRARAFLHS